MTMTKSKIQSRAIARHAGALLPGVVAAALMVPVAPAWAHHSFAMFDRNKSLTIDGTIKTVEWTNPHVWIWVKVPNKNGGTDDWGLESGGPSQMNRMGIRRAMFKGGDKITVDIYPMKDGRVGGQFRKATLADGTKIDMGASVKAFAAGGETVQQADGASK